MNFLITAAGKGSRLRKEGLKPLKPFIKIRGKEALLYSLDSIDLREKDNLIITLLNEKYSSKCIKKLSRLLPKESKNVYLDKPSSGQLTTAYQTIKSTNINGPLFIHNCDSYYKIEITKIEKLLNSFDVIVPYFLDSGNHWSFLKGQEINEKEITCLKVDHLTEKIKISDFASIGSYIFRDSSLITKYFDEYLKENKDLKEFYIAPFINHLRKKYNLKVAGIEIKGQKIFGTLEEICSSFDTTKQQLLAENDSIRGHQYLTLVVDVDETLCKSEGIKYSEYKDAKPYKKIIEKLIDLDNKGAYIIIYSSRNMRSFQGNLGLLNKHTLPTLASWLKRNNVPYDEIYLGKPWGKNVIYIDDKSIIPSSLLEINI